MKNSFIMSLIFLQIIICPFAAKADPSMSVTDANKLFAEGNAFYRTQDFEKAQAAYEKLLKSGYEVTPVLYNLGTVDARLGSSTLAKAYLTHALRLEPRNEDVRANLSFLTAPNQKPVPKSDVDSETAESLWSHVYGYMTVDEWLGLLWIALMVACVGGGLLFFKWKPIQHSVLQFVTVFGSLIFVIILIPAISQYYQTRIVQKMMVVSDGELHSGPAARFTRVTNLEEGQIVKVLQHSSDDYQHVQLGNGIQGYVSKEKLVKL